MGPEVVVVVEVRAEDAAEVLLIKHDDVVGALAPERADYPLNHGVRLRRSHGRLDSLDPDLRLDLGRDTRPSGPSMSALPGPVPPPGCAVPADDGLRLNENQRVSASEASLLPEKPETPVGFLEVRTARTGAHRELISERNILECELAPVPSGREQRCEYLPDDQEHRCLPTFG